MRTLQETNKDSLHYVVTCVFLGSVVVFEERYKLQGRTGRGQRRVEHMLREVEQSMVNLSRTYLEQTHVGERQTLLLQQLILVEPDWPG